VLEKVEDLALLDVLCPFQTRFSPERITWGIHRLLENHPVR
jgi:hypothetical protein